MRIAKVIGALLLVGALAGACGGDSAEDTSGGAATTGGAGGGSVTLGADDLVFNPTDLSAAAGDTIDFTNDDDVKHSFTVEELDIDEDADAGDSVSVSLGDAEPGTYDFICKYHPDMTGTLEVK